MATLIGAGGHAADIWDTLVSTDFARGWNQVEHHSYYLPVHEPVIIGINDPKKRAWVAETLHILDEAWIHPSAYIGPDCIIGHGTHVNYMASMTRTTIGAHTTIAPGVTICGDVHIGDRVFIGAGAVVRNLVNIADGAFIPMGVRVIRDVKADERYSE